MVKFLYILVSNEKDIYYEQTLVSVLSLRHYNPDAFVTLLVDDKTDKTLKDKYDTNANYDRWNYRMNVDVDITKTTVLRLGVSGNLNKRNSPGIGDDKVWGHDRAFFAEESLFYPYCDCEDRSILFTRLVRDLLGLDCILIYYPGHLASAVHFTEREVNGDYIILNNIKYIVSDATYIGAPVGRTMPGMNNEKAKVILLERN